MFVWFVYFFLSYLTPVPLPSWLPFPPFPYEFFSCPDCIFTGSNVSCPIPYPVPSCPTCNLCPECPICHNVTCGNISGIPEVNATLVFSTMIFRDHKISYKDSAVSTSYW